MTPLPPGWEHVRLDEVAEVHGGIQKQQRRRPIENKYPFLRVANVLRGKLDLTEVHEVELFEGELERFTLAVGDLLVVEGNGSPSQIGRAAVWKGEISSCVHQNHLIRVRPTKGLIPDYLGYLWNSPLVERQLQEVASSTSGLYTLSTAKLKRVRIPLPPLAEQRRIVATLDELLSSLDTASKCLDSVNHRLLPLRRSRLHRLRLDAIDVGAEVFPLDVVADTMLGKMLDSKKNTGQPVPYLRNINVRWGSIETMNILTVPMAEAQRAQYQVKVGDLLVCEGGEPGRCAIWRDSTLNVGFQKALHRVRPKSAVDVDWLALMIEESVRNGRTESMLTGTTIKHLPQEKLRALEVPIPHFDLQRKLVQIFSEDSFLTDKQAVEAEHAATRASNLRRSVLAEAFAGRLVEQDPADEPASVLLERISAERTAAGSVPRNRGRARKATGRDVAPREH